MTQFDRQDAKNAKGWKQRLGGLGDLLADAVAELEKLQARSRIVMTQFDRQDAKNAKGWKQRLGGLGDLLADAVAELEKL